MPTLAKTFPKLTGWSTYLEALSVTNGFIRNYVQSRVESHKEGCINDFTDAYIQQINQTTDPESSFYKEEGSKNETEDPTKQLEFIICILAFS